MNYVWYKTGKDLLEEIRQETGGRPRGAGILVYRPDGPCGKGGRRDGVL